MIENQAFFLSDYEVYNSLPIRRNASVHHNDIPSIANQARVLRYFVQQKAMLAFFVDIIQLPFDGIVSYFLQNSTFAFEMAFDYTHVLQLSCCS